eukprot:COSAG06_NODE_60123_length_272_cov_0.560694_1_plen_53_part_10
MSSRKASNRDETDYRLGALRPLPLAGRRLSLSSTPPAPSAVPAAANFFFPLIP